MTAQDIGITAPGQVAPAPLAPPTPPTQGVTIEPPKELSQEERVTWERIQALKDEVREREESIAELTGQLRMRLGRGEFSIGGVKVFGITPNKRFNQDQAYAVLPPAVVRELEKTVIDTDKAKNTLSPAWYALCQTEVGQDRVAPVTRRNS